MVHVEPSQAVCVRRTSKRKQLRTEERKMLHATVRMNRAPYRALTACGSRLSVYPADRGEVSKLDRFLALGARALVVVALG